MEPIENLRKIRLEKLKAIQQSKIDPYPSTFQRQQTLAQALQSLGKKVVVAGRIMSFRSHGKITFANLRDESAQIQLLFKADELNSQYEFLKNLDIGDFLGVTGEVFKTDSGEITIRIQNFNLITKSLRPIPSEFYGLKDIETRLRKRYLDLIVNPEEKEIFRKKSQFWQNIRNYLLKEGFLEVETPVLEAVPGGADARPFITHHNALDTDFYLRISLELHLKRLIVGGFEQIFEIGRVFRNEGIDAEHLQDYTMMEFYWAYHDLEDLINFIQKMYQETIQNTFGTLKTQYDNQEINWSGQWPRIDYFEAFYKATGSDLEKLELKDLEDLAKKYKIEFKKNLGKGRLIDLIYKKLVRPKFIQPCFLVGHPIEVSPLAKKDPQNPAKTLRMQVLACGSELGNGYSELNDPLDQRTRFEEQMKLIKAGDEEAQRLDEDFIESLEYGMPPTAGFGVSERLFAILVNKPVRETVFFPPMR